MNRALFSLIICIGLLSCNTVTDTKKESISTDQTSYFQLRDSEYSGIDFVNTLDESKLTNPYNYINLYNGSGVSIGDINNDGLADVFFASNMAPSKLYLNKDNMQFEDITVSSGIATVGWCTASTMADINNDGLLDIYVCRSYNDNPELRKNLIYINKGNNTFSEMGSQLGINDENYSIASSFFDYDSDGDLDLVVGNHPRYVATPFKFHYDYWRNPVLKFSNRLFRNDGSRFTEVTKEAGLMSYGHTLGLCTSDYNMDGHPDIYITVDHAEPDYLFKNNGDGTFTNVIATAVPQTPKSSMGIDAGDLNHDIYPDIFISEMLSEDHFREKVHMDMTNINRFKYIVDTLGYKYYQMHNFLYLNNGNGNFSDIAQMAGVHKSDWSWSNLFMDFDNDGWQDIFISNGWYKAALQKDFKKELDKGMIRLGNDMAAKNKLASQFVSNLEIDKIPNYLFKNNGDLTFEKFTEQAGLDLPTISTGAAYGDLDNDGDLDLVINNVNDKALVYENMLSNNNNFIKVECSTEKEMNGVGSKVTINVNGEIQSRQILTARGFQSSSEPIAHFGLGNTQTIDELKVIWSDGKTQVLENVSANQTLKLNYSDAVDSNQTDELVALGEMADLGKLNIDFRHYENEFKDFDIQILLPHEQSEYGPHIAVGDVNGDGLDDVYFPAPHQQMGRLYIQKEKSKFESRRQDLFYEDRNFEDGKCEFVDIDGDLDKDLIVSSTGYEFKSGSPLYKTRVYYNNGQGNFTTRDFLDQGSSSSSCVRTCDYDNDGDVDIFIGGRLQPHAYPVPGTSVLLVNNGQGQFENKITEIAAELENIGMIHDAIWTDIDSDGDDDLIAVGEWMPVSVFINDNGILSNKTKDYFDTPLTGWWNSIELADLDNDGQNELVVGNLGTNYKYKANFDKPFTVYSKDIDNNGTHDIVLGTYYGDQLFPVRGKTCSTQQLPEFKDVYKTYTQYASLELENLYGERLEGAQKYEVNIFESLILDLDNGKFNYLTLPHRAQMAPVNGIVIEDVDNDGLQDIIVAGNLYQSEIETGRADSGTGTILINNGNLKFKALSVLESGLYMNGDVKSIESITIGGSKSIIAGVNNDYPKVFKFNDLNI